MWVHVILRKAFVSDLVGILDAAQLYADAVIASLVVFEQVRHKMFFTVTEVAFRKYRNCTIRVGKTKVLISFAVTAKLICAFVLASACCWFSYGMTHQYGPPPIGAYEK